MKNPSVYAFCFVLFSVVNRLKAVVNLGLSDPTCYDLRTSLAVLSSYESSRGLDGSEPVFSKLQRAWLQASPRTSPLCRILSLIPDSLCQFSTFLRSTGCQMGNAGLAKSCMASAVYLQASTKRRSPRFVPSPESTALRDTPFPCSVPTGSICRPALPGCCRRPSSR